MKTLIQLTFLSILFVSCGGDEISYPVTYVYDGFQEVNSSILTEDLNGNSVKVDIIQSLNVPLCVFFNSIQGDTRISSITLKSESELEISITLSSGAVETMTVPYMMDGDVILEEFGLRFDENDNVISNLCFELIFAPSKNINSAEGNFCLFDNNLDPSGGLATDFISEGYQVGDTLGTCLANLVYKKQ